MKNSYIDYAMSVIVGRALPDVRDGLKPVHRRILYGMYEMDMTADRPHRKSSHVVGIVMSRYHPHGDAAIYDAMVRLAQDFNMRYPLVDGHGNFGSVDGDSPAAMRYTEVRLTKLAAEMLADIHKETVDFMPNYDDSLKEPVVLPSRFPNLLVNGSSGIAVGMATNIPPHNLGEVIDALVLMIEQPDVTVEQLMKKIKGPDFPTGGIILGTRGIREAYLTGKGLIKVRAKVNIEEMANGRERIVVTEIPYQVNKAKLVENIAALVRDKVIEGISDLRDESDRNGMRVVIELKKDVPSRVILNQLYKHTQLQYSFGIINLALVDGRPRVLNLRDMLYYYLEHQKEVVTRRTKFDLAKAEARAHIVEGLRIALQYLDQVIKIIRESRSRATARDALMSKFSLTQAQADAILDMRLHQLTGLEREKLEEEYKELQQRISYLREVLANESILMGIIKDELLAIREKYSDPRRTRIAPEEQDIDIEDLIAEEEIVVTVTHRGYIKRMPLSAYRSQKRGGKGITGLTTREDDFVEHLFVATTHHQLMFFTNRGKVYRLKGYEIPEAGRTARGTAVVNLLPLSQGEFINTIIPVGDFSQDGYLFMATRQGVVKKTELSQFTTSRKEGLIAISLDENDELIGVKLTDGNQEIILGTREGLAIRFPEEQVRPMGRSAGGVKGISLEPGDAVVGMDIAREGADLLVLTENGYGKRTGLEEYRSQARGGKGILNIKMSKRNGKVIGISVVQPGEELMIISSDGIIIRLDVNDISRTGRVTQGVTLMRLENDQRVVAMAKVVMRDEGLNGGD
ncbi:MAG TPA: DNA gyrase subunit A [Clostridia bacterium]|nr:DNA gyrase subunit A [Clostridia bacterium]